MTSMFTVETVRDVLVINDRSAVPSYKQVADQLRAQIRDGRIALGTVLPSITTLTGETGLSVQTVRRGIAILAEEGYVVVVPGRGTYAADKLPPA
jgi:DNA-binding GntR family transcriptional regulator